METNIYKEIGDRIDLYEKQIISPYAFGFPESKEAVIDSVLKSSLSKIIIEMYRKGLFCPNQDYVIRFASDVLDDQTGAIKMPECCTYVQVSLCPVEKIDEEDPHVKCIHMYMP